MGAHEAGAQQRVRWQMQSANHSSLPHNGPSGVRFVEDISRLSDGRFEIKFFEPGALIPPLECFDAVSRGSIQSCWTTAGFDTGKYPALAFFSSIPFGPQLGEYLAWKWFGGGNALRDEIYGKHGLAAGSQNAHAGCVFEYSLGKDAGGLDEVLAAVQDQQHLPVPQMHHQRRHHIIKRLDDTERCRNGSRKGCRIGHGGEVDEAGAIAECRRLRTRERQRNRCLADPARPRHRYETPLRQFGSDRRHDVITSDHAREQSRNASHSLRGDGLGWPFGGVGIFVGHWSDELVAAARDVRDEPLLRRAVTKNFAQ